MIKVEVVKFRPIDKGSLKGFFDMIMQPIGIKICDCTYFVKGDNKWFNLPQKEIKKEGQKSEYFGIVTCVNKEFSTKLTMMVLEQIKIYIGENEKSDPFATDKDYVQGQTPFIWP